jgi:hypothetical protein
MGVDPAMMQHHGNTGPISVNHAVHAAQPAATQQDRVSEG